MPCTGNRSHISAFSSEPCIRPKAAVYHEFAKLQGSPSNRPLAANAQSGSRWAKAVAHSAQQVHGAGRRLSEPEERLPENGKAKDTMPHKDTPTSGSGCSF